MDFNRGLVTHTIILYCAEVILFICVQYPFLLQLEMIIFIPNACNVFVYLFPLSVKD